MNKQEFLAALRKALAVLEEEELRDIVDEYEQHIDMKVANGLTEEEAIADFGDFKELTAELLEAYHVRADYAAVNQAEESEKAAGRGMAAETEAADRNGRPKERRETRDETEEAGRGRAGLRERAAGAWLSFGRKIKAAGGWCWRSTKSAAGWCVGSMKAAAAWIWRAALWCFRQLERPFLWTAGILGIGRKDAEERKKDTALGTKEEGGAEMAVRRGFWEQLGGGIAAFYRWCVEAFLWCVRMTWNLFCVGIALFVGLAGVFFLFALGAFFVLVLSGYPFAGLVIGSLGAAVSLFAAAGFMVTLFWRKRRAAAVAARSDMPAGRRGALPAELGTEALKESDGEEEDGSCAE